MQYDAHVWARRRFVIGREIADRLVNMLPCDGRMTNEDAVHWLRAMEAVLRISYGVRGEIAIRAN